MDTSYSTVIDMKKIIFFFLSMLMLNAHAQSNLPACTSQPFNNCFGEWIYGGSSKYIGDWVNDKYNGQGTYTQGDWFKYIGQFKDGKFNGQGSYTFIEGKYIGQFRDDKYHGYGILYYPNGKVFQQGLWNDGKFIQAQNSPTVTPPVVPKPLVNHPQDIKRQKCIRLGLLPDSADFKECMN